MRDWSASGRRKVERAYEHIHNLEGRIQSFREREPYQIVPKYKFQEDGPDLGGTSFHVHVREHPDPMWSAIAADAVHNLHVALDHLWQRAIYGTGHGSRDQFPVRATPAAANSRFRGKEKGAVKAAVDLLWSVNAFEVGNPFWSIRRFDDTDKHDAMTLVAVSLSDFGADLTHFYGAVGASANRVFRFRSPSMGLHALEEGAQLYFLSGVRIPEEHAHHDLPFEIAFGEGEVLKGEAVVPTLENLAAAVDSLATAFIAERLIK